MKTKTRLTETWRETFDKRFTKNMNCSLSYTDAEKIKKYIAELLEKKKVI